MNARFCTVEESSLEAALAEGAKQLGVPLADLAADEIAPGRFRVLVRRAPATIDVTVASDGMEATVMRITPSLGECPQPTSADVVEALERIGVKSGLLLEAIEELVAAVAESGFERKNVTVALGQRPRPGADAEISRHFPTEREQGARCAPIVRDAQLLIERTPPTSGEAGVAVTGRTLAAEPGSGEQVRSGPGIASDSEGRRWTASVRGFGYLELDDDGVPSVRPALTISADHLRAFIELGAPAAGEAPIARSELLPAITAGGVVHGLRMDLVDLAWEELAERGTLPSPALIAEGTAAVPGRDASMEFLVDPYKAVGELDAVGSSIDFRERHMIKNVTAGQVVATWTPESDGTAGLGVDGVELPAPRGERVVFTAGQNVTARELDDGRIEFESEIDGMFILSSSKLDVVDLLEVQGDVDYETGNIDAHGSVLVRGSVLSGFRVSARGDVSVQGHVDDAVIEAGRSVEVGQGIHGSEHGWISAGSHVRTRFAQNARILCEGDVEIRDSDLNSVIECRGRLLATEARGILRGGCYTAFKGVKANEIGSALGVPTVVAVGTDRVLERALRDVRDALRAAREREAEEQQPSLVRVMRTSALERDASGSAARPESVEALVERQRKIEAELATGLGASVDACKTMHAGVDMRICGLRLQLKETCHHVRYRCDHGSGRILGDALGASLGGAR